VLVTRLLYSTTMTITIRKGREGVGQIATTRPTTRAHELQAGTYCAANGASENDAGTNKQTPWSGSASDRRLSAKLVPTFADSVRHVVSVTDPYSRCLGILDRSSYFSFK
jgi:hypothetical protein